MTKKVTQITKSLISEKIEEPRLSGGGAAEINEDKLSTTSYSQAQRDATEAMKLLKRQKEAKRNMAKTELRLQSKVLYEWIDRELRRIPQDKIKISITPTKELDFKQEEYPYTKGIDRLVKRFMKGYDAFTYEHVDPKSGNAKWMSRFEIKHDEDGSVVIVSIWKW